MKTRLGTHRFQHADMAIGLLISKRFVAEVRTLEAMRTQAFSEDTFDE
jgi:hypothetical protein